VPSRSMLALFPAIGIPLCQDPYVEEYLGHATPGRWSGTARQDDCVPALLCFYHNSVMSAVSVAGEFPSAYTIVAAAVPRVRGKRWTASTVLFAPANSWRASHPSKRNSRKKSVGSTKTCRASPKPAWRPRSHHPAAVSGKVACGDVMPDLVPFGRRQYAP
jgi:hypothetical protein